MPLYEYQCDACGRRFELIRKFSDPPLETCPVCGGTVRKLMSSPAFQFKGSGWYVTDYARKTPAGSETSESKDAASADADKSAKPVEKSDTKSDAKADTKSDAKADTKSGAARSKPAGEAKGGS
jgi:putative FmdB family regulatory protein